jgi:phosphoribosylformylglycinamidine synthase subunit PurS
MEFSVLVETHLRDGVADPEGATIERSLPALGFDGVSAVKVGKAFRFALESADEATARAEVDDMCRRFLTNPVIEGYRATVTASAAVRS